MTTTDDPRPNFAIALDMAERVLAGVAVDQRDHRTPCTDFSVDRLSSHLLAVINRIGVVGRTGTFGDSPISLDDIDFTDRPGASAALAESALAAWSADGALDRTVTLPFGVLPGAVALMIYVNELTVHSWDLATATGQQPEWDEQVLAMAFAAMQQGLPPDVRSANGDGADGMAPFAAVVEVAADAPLIDRLVAWNGRRPDFQAGRPFAPVRSECAPG